MSQVLMSHAGYMSKKEHKEIIPLRKSQFTLTSMNTKYRVTRTVVDEPTEICFANTVRKLAEETNIMMVNILVMKPFTSVFTP